MLTLASFVISLAGLDTASPYGGLGASRASWIGSMAEPALILVFFTVGAVSASDNPYLMNHAVAVVAVRGGAADAPARAWSRSS